MDCLICGISQEDDWDRKSSGLKERLRNEGYIGPSPLEYIQISQKGNKYIICFICFDCFWDYGEEINEIWHFVSKQFRLLRRKANRKKQPHYGKSLLARKLGISQTEIPKTLGEIKCLQLELRRKNHERY